MMTFVPGATPRMEEVPFAVEGDSRAVAVARRIVRDLGAESFAIKKAAKPLYHALGIVFFSANCGSAGNGGAGRPRRRPYRQPDPPPDGSNTAPDHEELRRARSCGSFQRAYQTWRSQYRAPPPKRVETRPGASEVYRRTGEISVNGFAFGEEERVDEDSTKILKHRGKEEAEERQSRNTVQKLRS